MKRIQLIILGLLVGLFLGCQKEDTAAAADASVDISVEGMTCMGCANSITKALNSTPGIESCEVSLDEKKATVAYVTSAIDPDAVAKKISALGFKAAVVSPSE